jgi:hypothetical protein
MNTVGIFLVAMLLAASASAQQQFAGIAAACGSKTVNFDVKRDSSPAESGKIYYLRTRTFGQSDQALMDLDPLDSDEGRYLVSLYPLSVSRPKP